MEVYMKSNGIAFQFDDTNSEVSLFPSLVPVGFTDILIVEDDPTTSQYVKYGINKTVHHPTRIRSFLSSEKAFTYIMNLKMNNCQGPALAIVDYLLNGFKDGVWFCNELKLIFPESQIILTSTLPYTQIENKLSTFKLKPIYWQKPLNLKFINNFLI